MNKIKKVSFYFRLLFQALFILLPILTFYLWWKLPTGELVTFSPAEIFSLERHASNAIQLAEPLTLTSKWLGFLFSMIPLCLHQGILYLLIRLFRQFEAGQIFMPQNIHALSKIGKLLLIKQLLDPILGGLLTGTMTWFNPPGKGLIAITIDGTNFGLILAALLIMLISWIMAEGYKLEEEQRLTI